MYAAVYSPVNLEDYLTRGLNIVSRLADVSKATTQFMSEQYSLHLGREAVKAAMELGTVFCGEGIIEILSVAPGDLNTADRYIESAVKSHIGRVICVKLTEVCRQVAAEYEAMACTMSLHEAADYLGTRFTGRERLVSMTKVLLRTGWLMDEEIRNVYVVDRGLSASMGSFSFLWNGAVIEARSLLETAEVKVTGTATAQQELQGVGFWETVERLAQFVPRPRRALDAVVAIALAERGIVLNCHPEGVNVLRAITGDEGLLTSSQVSVACLRHTITYVPYG